MDLGVQERLLMTTIIPVNYQIILTQFTWRRIFYCPAGAIIADTLGNKRGKCLVIADATVALRIVSPN